MTFWIISLLIFMLIAANLVLIAYIFRTKLLAWLPTGLSKLNFKMFFSNLYNQTATLITNIKQLKISKEHTLCNNLKEHVLPDYLTNIDQKPDLNRLNCRIQLAELKKGDYCYDALNIQICGTITALQKNELISMRVTIDDITDGIDKPQIVQSSVKKWQKEDSYEFNYSGELGKLPQKITTISDWMSVAKLNTDWIIFPRRNKRALRFTVIISSMNQPQKLDSAQAFFVHENLKPGYLDLKENMHRTKSLAVALAFGISAQLPQLYDTQINVITNWAKKNIEDADNTKRGMKKLDKALKKTIKFFKNKNKLNYFLICKEIVDITPPAYRYEIIQLCLNVIKENENADENQLKLLMNIGDWLEINKEKFKDMIESSIPANMIESNNIETLLGMTSDMDEEQKKQLLTKQYRKWNSRVTNVNSNIRSQADYMLKLIAETRNTYC